MSDDRSPEQRFRLADELVLEYDGIGILVAYTSGPMLTLEDSDLTVEQARKLRDWLDEVLP